MKPYRPRAEQIRPLGRGRGGAISSDRITVDGRPVGNVNRIAPQPTGQRVLFGILKARRGSRAPREKWNPVFAVGAL